MRIKPSSASNIVQKASSIAVNHSTKRMMVDKFELPIEPMVWIDLEMTGLDVYSDVILEVACIVTDKNLTRFGPGLDIVIHQPKSILDKMNEWCIDHHGASGLTASCLSSKISLKEAEDRVMEYVTQYVPKNIGILAGNSVHMDRQFLAKYMPALTDYLHYRIIDVSTLKELAKRWHPQVYSLAPAKKLSHRALDDINESISELLYYKTSLFKE